MNDIAPPCLAEPEDDPFLLAAEAPPPAAQAFPSHNSTEPPAPPSVPT